MHIPDKFRENIKKLTPFEEMRKEKHSGEKIITDYNPVQYYEKLKKDTDYIYENEVIVKKAKIPKLIPTIGKWKKIGLVIQLMALIVIGYAVYAIGFANETLIQGPRENWDGGAYVLYLMSIVLGPVILLVVGGIVQTLGRKQFAQYIEVWNPLKAPMEIRKLKKGRIAIVEYRARNMKKAEYNSCFDKEGNPVDYNSVLDLKDSQDITVINSCYVIDKVKKVELVKDGIKLSSSGKFYGLRAADQTSNVHRTGSSHLRFYAWTECEVKERHEIIPNIFMRMGDIYADLRNY